MKKSILLLLLFTLFGCKNDMQPITSSNEYNGELVTNLENFGENNSPPKIGDPAPDFIMNPGTEEELSLSDMRGKVVYLYFWRTGCAPCRASIPHLVDKFNNELQSDKFVAIGISLDKFYNQSESSVIKFLGDYGMNFINIYDSNIRTKSIFAAYKPPFTPYSILISKDGFVVSNISPTSSTFVQSIKEEIEK